VAFENQFLKPYEEFKALCEADCEEARKEAVKRAARHLAQADKNLETLLLGQGNDLQLQTTKFVFKINGLEVDRKEHSGQVALIPSRFGQEGA
jgi:hypothetical protein